MSKTIINHHINKLIGNDDIGNLIMQYHGNKSFDIQKEGWQKYDFEIISKSPELLKYLRTLYKNKYIIDRRVLLRIHNNKYIFDQYIMFVKSTKSQNNILLTITKDRIIQFKTNSLFVIQNEIILDELNILNMELIMFINSSSRNIQN